MNLGSYTLSLYSNVLEWQIQLQRILFTRQQLVSGRKAEKKKTSPIWFLIVFLLKKNSRHDSNPYVLYIKKIRLK